MKRASSQPTTSTTPAKKISTSNDTDGFTTDSIPQHNYHLGENNYAVVSDFRDDINVNIRKCKTDDNGRILPIKKGVSFSPFVWESLSKEVHRLPLPSGFGASCCHPRHPVSHECLGRRCSACVTTTFCDQKGFLKTVPTITVSTN
ncbi:hypothetical protein AVEN_220164-1 [Araneus ventricosus]|uniref:Transcriptional coactivator p15 (PC4) C-terminal domain-containing protein n=1 Tax=Araneus ventricosus TaxID=182803 RepID=A0A4Y2RJR1_ARAVE|nr:hypothetical protein AVEN_220164-1 [Araneus ventricosus]